MADLSTINAKAALKLINKIEQAEGFAARARQRAMWRTGGTATFQKEMLRAERNDEIASKAYDDLRAMICDGRHA